MQKWNKRPQADCALNILAVKRCYSIRIVARSRHNSSAACIRCCVSIIIYLFFWSAHSILRRLCIGALFSELYRNYIFPSDKLLRRLTRLFLFSPSSLASNGMVFDFVHYLRDFAFQMQIPNVLPSSSSDLLSFFFFSYPSWTLSLGEYFIAVIGDSLEIFSSKLDVFMTDDSQQFIWRWKMTSLIWSRTLSHLLITVFLITQWRGKEQLQLVYKLLIHFLQYSQLIFLCSNWWYILQYWVELLLDWQSQF